MTRLAVFLALAVASVALTPAENRAAVATLAVVGGFCWWARRCEVAIGVARQGGDLG